MHKRAIQALVLTGSLLACSAAPESAGNAQTTVPANKPVSTRVPENSPLEPNIVNVPATAGRANLPPTAPPYATVELGRFNSPFAIAVLPGGEGILVTEKAGVLKLRRPDGTVSTVAGVPQVARGGQGGLLDIAAAPGFAADRSIYLSYAESGPDGSALALARATLDLNSIKCIRAPCPTGDARLTNVAVIWRSGVNGPGGQFGGNILFSPDGRYLFLSSGERQRFTPAQDPQQALGKLFRLTLDGKAAPGNPMFAKGGVEAMTWSSGHRNSYGMAFAPDGRLWSEEMGPRGGDELNLILPGKNYGWPIVSNGDNYSGQPIPDHPSRPDLEAPKLWWNPAISPTGMILYSGAKFPELKGSLLITSMSDAGLTRVVLDRDKPRAVAFWDFGARLRDIAQGTAGEIYLIEDGPNARLLQLEPKR
ncbi:MAG: PQQ-dependent sugar dehydrogenase [Sphingomicrobium sp.]